MTDRSQRLARAIANLRATGTDVAGDVPDWTKAPGPYEGITRQMVEDLDVELGRVRDQSTWLLRLVTGAIVVQLGLQIWQAVS